MTFVALAVAYMGACATIGLMGRRSDAGLVAALAALVVCAQLVLLLTR